MMSFISHSAIKGFSAAAALIIISAQLPSFLGIALARRENVFSILLELSRKILQVHPPTLAIGLGSLLVIFGLKKIRPRFPSGLVVLLLATLAVVLLDLDRQGVAVIGPVPAGLPHFKLPVFQLKTVSNLVGPALVMALVGFTGTYSVGKVISAETKQMVDVNQEFIGQGLANFAGAFFQCYPVGGSFSCTAINFVSGAKTAVSAGISSLLVLLALLFLTPLFTFIPKASLAALVISAVWILFHPKEVFLLWKMNRHDGIVAITVFVLALVTQPDYALLIGVIVSLMLFLWKTMHPRIVRVTKDPEFNLFVDADIHNQPSCPQILHLRSENALYFANAEYTVDHILKRVDEQKPPARYLLLDFQAVGFIDITGIDELRVLYDEIRLRNMELALEEVNLPVMDVFKSSGFFFQIKPGHIFENKAQAIGFLFYRLNHDYCRETCPYKLYYECSLVKSREGKLYPL
jgi:SulP family sulfate permease